MGNNISLRSSPSTSALTPEVPPSPVELVSTAPEITQTTETGIRDGWDSIRKFWDWDQPSMERYMVHKGIRMTFFVTFVIGGLSSIKESEKRIQLYSPGHHYGNQRTKFVRQTDFKILQFMKKGFKYSFKCCFVTGSVLLANTHMILYSDNFEYWYPPAVTASVTGAFAFPIGLLGSVQAATLGATSGMVASSLIYLYSLYRNSDSARSAYNSFREGIEQELWEENIHRRKVMELMKKEGIQTRIMAELRLRQIEEEEKISGGLENISDHETKQ